MNDTARLRSTGGLPDICNRQQIYARFQSLSESASNALAAQPHTGQFSDIE